MPFIKSLKAIAPEDAELVGVRACDLAQLLQRDFAVPLSFALTNEAFEAFIAHNKIQGRIAEALTLHQQEASYGVIRELILTGVFAHDMTDEVAEAYEGLGIDSDALAQEIVSASDKPFVSLFLSPNHATPTDSNEGIVLNVRGIEPLLFAIKECWACLFTPAMQRHRLDAGITNRNLNVGVIVQQMPGGEVSAEAWSATQGADELLIKAYYGAIDTSGTIAKDEFRITREYLKPIFSSVAVQSEMIARDEEERLTKVPIGERGRQQKTTDRNIIELARLAKKAHQALAAHVKLLFNLRDESARTLLCTRLLLTKGAIRLEGYEEEERIAEAPAPEIAGGTGSILEAPMKSASGQEISSQTTQAETLLDSPEAQAPPAPAHSFSPAEEQASEEDSIFAGLAPEPWTLARAYDAAVGALRHAHERRFHGMPPADNAQVFAQLDAEIMIPQAELIGKLVRRDALAEGEERLILGVMDDFLREMQGLQ